MEGDARWEIFNSPAVAFKDPSFPQGNIDEKVFVYFFFFSLILPLASLFFKEQVTKYIFLRCNLLFVHFQINRK